MTALWVEQFNTIQKLIIVSLGVFSMVAEQHDLAYYD